MNISSAQDNFSITLDDTITIDTSSWGNYTATGAIGSSTDTITITGGGSASTYTIGAVGSSGTVSFGGAGSSSSFIWKDPEEFVDALPDISRIEAMCKQYPGLKIAYEKFVTTYKLVKDDYDTPEDQRAKP